MELALMKVTSVMTLAMTLTKERTRHTKLISAIFLIMTVVTTQMITMMVMTQMVTMMMSQEWSRLNQ